MIKESAGAEDQKRRQTRDLHDATETHTHGGLWLHTHNDKWNECCVKGRALDREEAVGWCRRWRLVGAWVQ